MPDVRISQKFSLGALCGKSRVCKRPIIDHQYLLSTRHTNSIDVLSTTISIYTCTKTLPTSKSHYAIALILRYFHTSFQLISMCQKKVITITNICNDKSHIKQYICLHKMNKITLCLHYLLQHLLYSPHVTIFHIYKISSQRLHYLQEHRHHNGQSTYSTHSHPYFHYYFSPGWNYHLIALLWSHRISKQSLMGSAQMWCFSS